MKKIIALALVVCAACSGSSPLEPTPPAPPVISDISVATITPSSAELHWVTDTESDSQVEYGTTADYGSMSASDSQPVTTHRVTIDGLGAETTYHYRVRSRDKHGNLAFSERFTFSTPRAEAESSGITGPSKPVPPPVSKMVKITTPASGTTVSGTVAVAAIATDPAGVIGVQFKRNGANLGSEDRTAPYAIDWNTSGVTNGNYTITAVIRNAKGHRTTSADVVVTVANGTTAPPTVAISSPAEGATVSGTITVTATASGPAAIAGVTFSLDGADLGTEDTESPYSIDWDTATASNGSHTLTAVVRDARGKSASSRHISVTVSNGSGGGSGGGGGNTGDHAAPSVTVTAPAAGAVVSGTVAVSATASDAVGVAGVQFMRDGSNLGAEDTTAPYSINWNTTGVANGSYTITAVARDAAGNTASSSGVTVTVTNVTADTIAPSVSVTSPVAAASISGTVSVTATASDNVGVAGVQFRMNGANLGAEDTASPYSVNWNTGAIANGSYTISAVARDAAGNTAASSGVTVTVANVVSDVIAPLVSVTSPLDGASLSSTVNVTATASDNVGVAGVQFQIDGANLGAEDQTSPYSVSWNTTTASNGVHLVTAIARDAANNRTTSVGLTVVVSNLLPPTGGTWPNQPGGYTTVNDQPWNALSSAGWYHQNRGASSSITADSSAPLSSSSVLRHSYPIGMPGGVEPAVDWYPLPSNFKEGYVGMWWKPSAGWQNHPSNVNKIFFIFGSAGHIIPVMYGTGGGTYQLRMAPEWGGWSWLVPNVNSGNITLGQWHRIEVYFKQQTTGGIIRWWMDGRLIGDYTNVAFPSTMQFQELQIAPTWGGVGGTKSQQDYFWFDHVHVSRP